MPFKNTQRRTAFIWLIVSILGLLAIFITFIFEIDIMDGGGALIFIGLFIFITGIIVSIMYFRRAGVIDKAAQGNMLAHWRYDTRTWKEFAEEDYTQRKSGNKALFILISSICIIVGVIFFIADPEAGLYVLLAMMGMVVILGVTAILSAVLPYRRNKKYVGEVYIFNDGLFINGATHIWKGFSARLESVAFSMESKNCLEFVYSAITRAGRQYYTVLVPIPQGRESEAASIVGYFNWHTI